MHEQQFHVNIYKLTCKYKNLESSRSKLHPRKRATAIYARIPTLHVNRKPSFDKATNHAKAASNTNHCEINTNQHIL